MYFPNEVLDQAVVFEPLKNSASRAGSQLFTISGYTGHIVRNGTRELLDARMPPVNEDLAKALFELSDEYYIDFPGIGCLAISYEQTDDNQNQAGYLYTTASMVNGLNMHYDMADVPLEVTIATVEKMLTYYEAMSGDFSNKLYLADLSLRQCIYGRTEANIRPGAHFVDYDRRLSNISKILFSRPFANFGEGFGGIAGLDDDLYALKANYPYEDFGEIAERLLKIANVQGIFYKTPTAYYQVNGLSPQAA